MELPYTAQNVFDALVTGAKGRGIAAVAPLTMKELLTLPTPTNPTRRTVEYITARLVVKELAHAAPVAAHALPAVDARLRHGL